MDRTKDVPERVKGGWEIFSDVSYYDMWCVRPDGEKRWGEGFHVVNQEGAERARDFLIGTTAEIADLRAENERLQLDGIHTCHDECQRPTCVLRRELDEAMEAGNRLLQYEGHQAYCGHGNDMSKPCVCGYIEAQDALRRALAKPEVSK